MTQKKPYFPNNWAKYAKAPAEMFQEISWEEFHDWRLCQWELPENVNCIIRVAKKSTGAVKEYVYQSFSAAGKRIEREMEDPDNEITIADCNEIHLIYSELKSNDEHE